jgi:hypothetical protein
MKATVTAPVVEEKQIKLDKPEDKTLLYQTALDISTNNN